MRTAEGEREWPGKRAARGRGSRDRENREDVGWGAA